MCLINSLFDCFHISLTFVLFPLGWSEEAALFITYWYVISVGFALLLFQLRNITIAYYW